jgi:hypothetical protein
LAFIEVEVRKAKPEIVAEPPNFVTNPLPRDTEVIGEYVKDVATRGHHLVVIGKLRICARCKAKRGLQCIDWDNIPCGKINRTTDRNMPEPPAGPVAPRTKKQGTQHELGEWQPVEQDEGISIETEKIIRHNNTKTRKKAEIDVKKHHLKCKTDAQAAGAHLMRWEGFHESKQTGDVLPRTHPWYLAHPSHHLHVQDSGQYAYCSLCYTHSSLSASVKFKDKCNNEQRNKQGGWQTARKRALLDGIAPDQRTNPWHVSTMPKRPKTEDDEVP